MKLQPRDAAVLDARTGRVLAAPLRGTAAAIAVAGGRAWVAVSTPQGIVTLPSTGRAARVVKLRAPAYSLAAAGGAVWVAPGYEGTVQRIAGGRATLPFRPAPSSRGRVLLAGAPAALWVASQDGYLRRLDPRTRRVTAAVRVGLPNAIAAGFGSIWVASASADQIVRVDAASGHVLRRINIGGIATSVAAGPGSVWAATPANGSVWQISPRLNAVLASMSPLAQPAQVAAVAGRVWVASGSTGALAALDSTWAGRAARRAPGAGRTPCGRRRPAMAHARPCWMIDRHSEAIQISVARLPAGARGETTRSHLPPRSGAVRSRPRSPRLAGRAAAVRNRCARRGTERGDGRRSCRAATRAAPS